MTNAQIIALLSGLSDAPRPLGDLLPGAGRAEVREVADYLSGAGLVGVRFEQGLLMARIAEAGRAFVKRASRGL
jgi:hypothetical protein